MATEEEAMDAMTAGLELLSSYSRIIAMMPLEKWLQAFNRAETIAPVVDPTLYREYLYSGRGEIIKGLIQAALPLKRQVLAVQPKLGELMARDAAVAKDRCPQCAKAWADAKTEFEAGGDPQSPPAVCTHRRNVADVQ